MESTDGSPPPGPNQPRQPAPGEIRADSERAPEILAVDDEAANLLAIEVALGDLGRRLTTASSGSEALRRLLDQDFSVVLLDVKMPGLDGFETARLIRQRSRSRHLPIIFVTAYNRDDTDVLRGYELGAVDFLFKPIVPEVLRAKVSVLVELQRRTAQVREQGERLRELERREAERKLREEKQRWEAEALREENRRKDQFLALLAHELRNPLAPMVTGLELVRRFAIEHEGLEWVRGSMERQVSHLVRLVDDLLDVSRISQGKVVLRAEAVSLRAVVEQALENVRPLIEEQRHRLDVTHPPEDLEVIGDAVRLTQVLANLLNNAARYTDPGGTVRLEWARDGEEAVLRVADDGRGIAEDMLERIFDMFVQEQGDGGKGLGLGLTLVHQLVDLHGGTVRAYSAGRGRGSELVVRLPLAGTKRALSAAGSSVAAAERGESAEPAPLHIVLVEDEADIRRGLTALLEQWGHLVECAADGEAGIDLILDRRPDLALVDIAMPRTDGYAVAERVRQALGPSGPRLVALTGFGRAEDRQRAKDAGFDHHLVKPASPEDLRRLLRSTRNDTSCQER